MTWPVTAPVSGTTVEPSGRSGGSGIEVVTGGRTGVDTDEVREAAILLTELAARVSDWRVDLRAAVDAVTVVPDSARYDLARDDLHAADGALERAADAASRIGEAAGVAATVYGGAEDLAQSLLDGIGAYAGQAFGLVVARSLPLLLAPTVVAAMPVVVPGLVAAGVLWANPITRRAISGFGADLGAWIAGNSRLVATPGAVGLLKAAVSTSDDVLKGLTGAPSVVTGSGLAGVASSPLVGGALRLADTPVAVSRIGPPLPVAPPSGVADVASRIPANAPGAPQIRVERYATSVGSPRWGVYVGGTVELVPAATDEALDIESAVGSVAGEDAAAYRAVVAAMEEAGVAPGDPVALAGHSQGGLVAAAVAASGEYAVDTVVTFGAPSAQVPVADGVTTVAVQHADDLVPALAGSEPVGDERTVVSRDTRSRDQPGDSLFGAHSIEEYERTAGLMDASDDRRMLDLRKAIARMAPVGADGSASDYRADRVPG